MDINFTWEKVEMERNFNELPGEMTDRAMSVVVDGMMKPKEWDYL